MPDILIRGMEMPKDGSLWLLIRPDGTVLKIKNNDKLGLPKEGAAIFLPEGHGDLIDKQAFIADIAGFIECMSNVGVLVDGETLWGKLLDALANAKTVVPAEGGTNDA